ncbi:hypothetical protein AAAT68_16650 [Lawsonibacter asaccharolyticus]
MADKNIGSLPAASTVDDDSLLVAEQQGQAVKVTGAQFKGFAQQSVQQYVEQAQEAASDALEASEQALEAVAGIGTAVEDTKANKEAAEAAQAAAEQAQAGAEAAAQGAAEEVKEELQGLVDQAETAKTGAETAESGAEAARTAIENMLVEAITLETGQPATVSKSLVDEVVKLTFGLPAGPVGPKGETGDPGSSIDRIERTSGTGAAGTTDTYTIYLTDGKISTFQVYNGADGIGSGDMLKSIYDPQGMNTDVFKYVDDKIADIDIPTPENIVTVPGGGQLEMAESLGSGPYTITFSEDEGEGGSFSASDVDYSNTTSGLEATDVQGAIDELAGRPSSGLTQEQADQRYLKLSGGTMEDSAEIIGNNLTIGSNTLESKNLGVFSVSGTSAIMQSQNQNSVSYVETMKAKSQMFAQNDTNSSAYSSVMADGGKVTLESVQDDSHKAYMELKHDGQIGFAFSSGETVHMLTVDASGVNVFDPPTEGTNVVNKDYLEQAISDAGGTEVETTLTVLTASGWDSNSKTQRAEVTGILADETKQLIQPVPAISSQQEYMAAGIMATEQSDGALIFTAKTVPNTDLRVYINIQSVKYSVNLISFSIDDAPFQAESGMTWYQWGGSQYNTAGFTCSSTSSFVYDSQGTKTVMKGSSKVTGSELIESEQAYTTQRDSGGID